MPELPAQPGGVAAESTCCVVSNDDSHLALWPATRPSPEGWTRIGLEGSRSACAQWIEANWVDIRPNSPVDTGDSIPLLFEQQVSRTPHAAALICGDRQLTFAELHERSLRLARILLARGIGAEDRVAVAAPRSAELVAAMLGVMRAGAVYVPLDPAYPPARLAYMLRDSGARLMLATEPAAAAIARCADELPPVASLDPDDDDSRPVAVSLRALAPSSLAYVVYTSGSTGQPKGVAATHAGLVNRLRWQWEIAPYGPDEVACAKTSPNFVDSLPEVLSPLLAGTPLVIAPAFDAIDPARLARLVADRKITRLTVVPSLLEALLDTPSPLVGLRHLICSGEALERSLADRFHAVLPHVKLWNYYGSSEVNGDSLAALVRPDEGPVPIGRPISDTRAYVLDQDLEPVGAGGIGELYTSGVGLARGYLGQPALTAERFIPCPFGPSGSRMYRTGDLVRTREDGTIDYVGRADAQLNLRGFRIEPGEVEAALREIPGVAKASVQAREIGGETRLVAWVVAAYGAAAPTPQALRHALAQRLPAHMVPAAFVATAEFPLTPNGKLDRIALPTPGVFEGSEPYRAPTDEDEALVCRLFAELTGADRVGMDDNFFDLGGSSLGAMRLLARLRETTGCDVPHKVFERATPAAFAVALAQPVRQPEEDDLLVELQPQGALAPFFCVHSIGGGVLHMRHLAQAMGLSRPFIGIRGAPRADFEAGIEDMAAAYLRIIRGRQPSGPYYLGGYSFGAILAYEVARQLAEAGETIGVLAVIDMPWPQWRATGNDLLPAVGRWLANLPSYLRHELGHFSPAHLRGQLLRAGRAASRRLHGLRPDAAATVDLSRFEPEAHAAVDAHLAALDRYAPRHVRLPVVVIRARVRPFRQLCPPWGLGWDQVSDGPPRVWEVPGNHASMLEPPHVEGLGSTLQAALAGQDAPGAWRAASTNQTPLLPGDVQCAG